MEDNPSASTKGTLNPLQPVYELIQGGDPDLVCTKYRISRAQLDKLMSAYQASVRQTAVAGAYSASKTKRNDPCPCGSGKKYKKCCLPVHEEARKLIPKEQLQQMDESVKARERMEDDVRKGFELIFSREYKRADRFARKQLETFPEDDRFHDILVSACFGLGDYETAFRIARKRWQTAVEEKIFFQEKGSHKRGGVDGAGHVHFFSPPAWLEKFWIAQRALAWREHYPVEPGSEIAKFVEKLQAANDLKRFPAKQEEGFEARRQALAPVLEKLQSEGPGAIPFLLPITYNFTWASLFVPELLHAWGTDECVRLLVELSMFRYPYFSQKCLDSLVETGESAIPVISLVMEENPAFDELKAGLLSVLGNFVCMQSFGILAKFTEHENRYVAAWACEALERHNNSEALPYLERAKERMGPSNQKIAEAIKEIAEPTGK